MEFGDGYGEADVGYDPALIRPLDSGRVDPNHFALDIYERTAAIARIYRRVGLQHLDAGHGSKRRDDAPRYGQVRANPVGDGKPSVRTSSPTRA